MIAPEARRRKAADLLVLLRSRGIKVWRDNGCLRYQAPKGLLTQDDLEKLGAAKADLIALLQPSSDEGVGQQITSRLSSDHVPLTFSQELMWRCLQLETRPSMRSLATARRLTGPLDVACLRKCFSQLVRRHEALRTRIVAHEGVPRQVVDEPTEFELEIADLRLSSSGEQAAGIRKVLEKTICEPFSVATGPLFAVSLMVLGDEEHLLVVAMDHMISDIASLGIVWREIFAMYGQFVGGMVRTLTRSSVQFADYAVWLGKTNQSWTQQHGAYWKKRLAGGKRLRPLENGGAVEEARVGLGREPVRLTEDLRERVHALCRERKTSSAMIALALYVAFLLRWSEVADLVVAFISLGRHDPKVESTIGYFGNPLYLRIETVEGDSFLDLLERVTEEYSIAYEHSDCGRVAAESPTPEFAWNPRFNWVPQELERSACAMGDLESNTGLKVEPYGLEVSGRDDIQWEGDLQLFASEGQGGVSGSLVYRTDRVAARSIERFARSFESFAEQLLRKPGSAAPAVLMQDGRPA